MSIYTKTYKFLSMIKMSQIAFQSISLYFCKVPNYYILGIKRFKPEFGVCFLCATCELLIHYETLVCSIRNISWSYSHQQ